MSGHAPFESQADQWMTLHDYGWLLNDHQSPQTTYPLPTDYDLPNRPRIGSTQENTSLFVGIRGPQALSEATSSLPPPYDASAYNSPELNSHRFEPQQKDQHPRYPSYGDSNVTNTVSGHGRLADILQGTALRRKIPVVGSRSAYDRQHRAVSKRASATIQPTAPADNTTRLDQLPPFLIEALHKAYPHCNSVKDCIECFIQDHHRNTRGPARGVPADSFNPKLAHTGSNHVLAQDGTLSSAVFEDDLQPTKHAEDVSDVESNSDSEDDETSNHYNAIRGGMTGMTLSVDYDDTRIGQAEDEVVRKEASLASRTSWNHNTTESGKYLLYACPFHKRDPARYDHRRACSGTGWEEVRRVKEHVYRHHSQPITCPRCSQEFETEATLHEHAISTNQCQSRQIPREGCSKQQEMLLKSKKDLRGKTETEKWIAMFRILFPDDHIIPSPYFESRGSYCSRILQRFKDDVVAKLPGYIERDISSHRSWSKFRASKLRFRPIVEQRMAELLQKLVDAEPGLVLPARASGSRTQSLVEDVHVFDSPFDNRHPAKRIRETSDNA